MCHYLECYLLCEGFREHLDGSGLGFCFSQHSIGFTWDRTQPSNEDFCMPDVVILGPNNDTMYMTDLNPFPDILLNYIQSVCIHFNSWEELKVTLLSGLSGLQIQQNSNTTKCSKEWKAMPFAARAPQVRPYQQLCWFSPTSQPRRRESVPVCFPLPRWWPLLGVPRIPAQWLSSSVQLPPNIQTRERRDSDAIVM